MSLRPTNKFILQHADYAARDEQTKSANEKVQALLKAGQSCGTCKLFLKSALSRCFNPATGIKKRTNHYNICSNHVLKESI